jgi:hypothetical protein
MAATHPAKTVPSVFDLLRVVKSYPKIVKPYVPGVWDEFLGIPGACQLRAIDYSEQEPLPDSASYAALSSLAIIRENDTLSLLTRFFIRRVTIFCLPGSMVSTAQVGGVERIYFCKHKSTVEKAHVVEAFASLVRRKLTLNPRLADQFQFSIGPFLPDELFEQVWFSYVLRDDRYLKPAIRSSGGLAVRSLVGMIDDLVKQLRDSSDLLDRPASHQFPRGPTGEPSGGSRESFHQ